MATERRLIDANAVPKLFEKKYEETEQRILDGETYLDTLAEGFTEADDVILSMPTVDAVEVVRCKDCIHFDPEKALRTGGIWCAYWGTDPDPDDFCSFGERREVK
jgi:hypothetical protein